MKLNDLVTLERGRLSWFRYPTHNIGTYLGRGAMDDQNGIHKSELVCFCKSSNVPTPKCALQKLSLEHICFFETLKISLNPVEVFDKFHVWTRLGELESQPTRVINVSRHGHVQYAVPGCNIKKIKSHQKD